METFTLNEPGDGMKDSIRKKMYWEVEVTDKKVVVIDKGGPMPGGVLVISGDNIKVEDWWGWGAG